MGSPEPTPAYRRLQAAAAALGWMCAGSVQRRTHLGARRLRTPVYQWTRKVKGKTVTVNLTVEQYQRMRTAIGNQRRLGRLTAAMQKMTAASIFNEKG